MFLTRVLDLGSLLLADALTESICLQAFKARSDTSCFGDATSSSPEVGWELGKWSRAGLWDVVAWIAVTFHWRRVCAYCIVLSGRLHFRNLNVNEK